ncbi:hypothetical protein A3L11_01840 [Thermococcus siculi]|uniref:Uncharacterized protein n=1 Tax=Thermococcus siculi TaxID=72803 RepID=A0A2Z2MV35_9EURY|nr:PrsW family glutamic-type intramembrane protease [Thermococcus siculi]ASJ08033.1 hypothetical protein A3L11_01840 [Thermococcus siculi]
MIEVIVLVLYSIMVLVVGVKLYFRADWWLVKVDRVLPEVSTGKAAVYAILIMLIAGVLEVAVMYVLQEFQLLLALAFPLVVGLIEEGAKLLPYFLKKGDVLRRWRLTFKVALVFAIAEAVLYGIALLASGNLLGALLRIIVVMFHVAFTSIALASALGGSPVKGYLKASILHGLYDAPIFSVLAENNSLSVLMSLLGFGAMVYTYIHINDAFEIVHTIGERAVEERKKEARRFWEEKGIELTWG